MPEDLKRTAGEDERKRKRESKGKKRNDRNAAKNGNVVRIGEKG